MATKTTPAKTYVMAPLGKAAKDKKTKTKRKKTRSNAGALMVVIAVVAHRFLSNIVSQYASTSPILNTIPYAAPLIIYFLAEKNIIPIPGLAQVALTILVKEASDDLMKPTSGYLSGFQPSRPMARSGANNVIDFPRTVTETKQIIANYQTAN